MLSTAIPQKKTAHSQCRSKINSYLFNSTISGAERNLATPTSGRYGTRMRPIEQSAGPERFRTFPNQSEQPECNRVVPQPPTNDYNTQQTQTSQKGSKLQLLHTQINSLFTAIFLQSSTTLQEKFRFSPSEIGTKAFVLLAKIKASKSQTH